LNNFLFNGIIKQIIEDIEMNVDKMKLEWFVQGDVLRLSVHYFKPSETSDSYSGCSSNWMRKMEDGDFTTAYNWIVDAAKEQFHLPNMKKIKVPKDPNAVKETKNDNHDVTIVMSVFALAIGLLIGSVFL
jgi:hypothetical protein